MGADIATTSANMLTVQTRFRNSYLKVLGYQGQIPITPISVLIIPNTPVVRMNTSRVLELSLNLFFIYFFFVLQRSGKRSISFVDKLRI